MTEAYSPPVYEMLFSGAFGAALVLCANVWLSWRQTIERVRGHWEALYVDVEECGTTAGVYVADLVAAPLYRLPTMCYRAGLPALLADSSISEDESRALLKFYSQVETLNRGIDFA